MVVLCRGEVCLWAPMSGEACGRGSGMSEVVESWGLGVFRKVGVWKTHFGLLGLSGAEISELGLS